MVNNVLRSLPPSAFTFAAWCFSPGATLPYVTHNMDGSNGREQFLFLQVQLQLVRMRQKMYFARPLLVIWQGRIIR